MTENIHPTLSKLIVPVDGLTHYGRNPRRGDADVIAESLTVNGQFRPIVVRAGTNEVLAGNHTLTAAKALGWKRIAVTFVDVDDDAAARIVLADNATHDKGDGYDDDLLTELLQAMPDLAGTGYNDHDLAKLLDDTSGDPRPDSADLLDDTEDTYREQYGVIVICATEDEQAATYEKLATLGYDCKVVTT